MTDSRPAPEKSSVLRGVHINKVAAAENDPTRYRIAYGTVTLKIYKSVRPGGYAVYQVPFCVGGRRKVKSATTLDGARAKAKRIAMALHKGDTESLAMNSDDRWELASARKVLLDHAGVSVDTAAHEYAACLGLLASIKRAGRTSVREAVQAYVDWQATGSNVLKPCRVPSLVTEFLEARQKGGAGQRHYSDLKSRLGQFAREFDGQLSAVTSRKITDWLDRRNLAPKSWNNFVNALGSLFIYAVSNRCLAAEHNPIKGVSKKKDVGGEIEVFTPGEIALLLQHATPDLLPVLAIGAFTGIRSAEIDRLEWSEVKFDTGFIVVGAGKAKTAARRVIPMPANLQAWLQPYQKLTGKVWPHSLDYRYGAMEKVTKASGVPWKQNALRHSYISYRLAETRDVNKVALEAGNSPAMIHGHYKALVTPVEAKAWFAVMPEMPANVTTMPTAAAVKVGARYCDGHVSQP